MTIPVDNLKMAIGNRIKVARSTLKLTQKELCEEIGMPLPSLRDYELGKRIPGGEAVAMFCCAGINANWLLLGDGPIFIADMNGAQEPTAINVEALVHAIAAIFQVAPKNEPIESLARKAVGFYQYCESQGLITPEGVGTGILKNTA